MKSNRSQYWKEYSRKRRQNPEYVAAQKIRYKLWQARNGHDPARLARQAANMRRYTKDQILRSRHKARWLAHRALITGRLIPMPCRDCGSLKAEMHHPDYSKPLDVVWLCRPCHRAEHSKATQS